MIGSGRHARVGAARVGKGVLWVSGFGVNGPVIVLTLVLLIELLSAAPRAECGCAVSIAFAVLANRVHCLKLDPSAFAQHDARQSAQIWAVLMVWAVCFYRLLCGAPFRHC